MPPPGVPHQVACVSGFSYRTSRTRSSSSTITARTAHRFCGCSHSYSDRNQRSRSSYGTAAFAGDVDGST